jgi:hypothetical protein
MMDMGISPGHTVGQPYCFGQPDSSNFSQVCDYTAVVRDAFRIMFKLSS